MKKEYKGSYEYRGREVEKELEELNKKDENAVGSSPGTVNQQNAVQWEKYANGLNVGVLLSHWKTGNCIFWSISLLYYVICILLVFIDSYKYLLLVLNTYYHKIA